MSQTEKTLPVLLAAFVAPTLALLLAGCDVRREGEATPSPSPEEAAPDAGSVPASEESPPSVSIIRDDIDDGPTVIESPPEPLGVTIPFPEGGADLSEGARRLLAGVLESDALGEGWPIVVGGHTDSAGNDRANLRASRARAEAVAAWLVERGVADDRINVVAFGEQNPIAPNALPNGEPDEQGRARNRRVQITIAPPENEGGQETEGSEPGASQSDTR